jgi:hypothetical protein
MILVSPFLRRSLWIVRFTHPLHAPGPAHSLHDPRCDALSIIRSTHSSASPAQPLIPCPDSTSPSEPSISRSLRMLLTLRPPDLDLRNIAATSYGIAQSPPGASGFGTSPIKHKSFDVGRGALLPFTGPSSRLASCALPPCLLVSLPLSPFHSDYGGGSCRCNPYPYPLCLPTNLPTT